jgi:carboxymethylenebutenolidase
MCTDHDHQGLIRDVGLTRREFVMGLGGLAVASSVGSTASAAEATSAAATKAAGKGTATNVVERDIEVPTAHGTADAALFYPPGKGQWPAVLVWPDILGLRPVFRELGRRLAAQGYTVLVPNPFYRSKRAPVVEGIFDFGNPADRAKVFAMRGAMSDAGIDSDSIAFLKFLDAQPQTNRRRKAGVHGYCMGGPLSFRTAAAAPERIGAVASFHGAGLVTAEPSSPHLLIATTQAEYLVAIAKNDDAKEPAAKETLQATFKAAGRPATVEVYQANHGWCVFGGQSHHEAEAERAWTELGKLYARSLKGAR